MVRPGTDALPFPPIRTPRAGDHTTDRMGYLVPIRLAEHASLPITAARSFTFSPHRSPRAAPQYTCYVPPATKTLGFRDTLPFPPIRTRRDGDHTTDRMGYLVPIFSAV